MYFGSKANWILLLLGILIGILIAKFNPKIITTSRKEIHLGTSKSGLTNPLLECELGSEYISQNSIRPFKFKIEQTIEELKQQGKVQFVSYYFRDLNNGTWFGFMEKEGFAPASLLKVPLMLFILKQAEHDTQLLNRKLNYNSGAVTLGQFYKSEQSISIGHSYSIRELLEAMITHSDNNATAILLQYFGSEKSKEIFHELGIDLLAGSDNAGSISVRDYAAFFRILFNASYLTQTNSEYALDLLTKTQFSYGIESGVPDNLRIAHKFGERDSNNIKQLHDCGIVYVDRSPYLICIMTRGSSFENLSESISKLSKATYDSVVYLPNS